MNLEIELVSKIYFLCEIQCFISFSSGYIDIAATYFTQLKRNLEMINDMKKEHRIPSSLQCYTSTFTLSDEIRWKFEIV